MILNKLKYYTFILLIFISCQSPTDIDVPRDIQYEYKIKKNIVVSVDTIDFGFVEKDAFNKELFRIKNITDKVINIKYIKLASVLNSQPSFFFFDPLQDLNDIYIQPDTNKSLNLYINHSQKNVGISTDNIVIQNDSTYNLFVKSIVPDIMVKDYGNIDLTKNDSMVIEVKIYNYSNYPRKIEKVSIVNDDDNNIKLLSNLSLGKWIQANSNSNIEFKVYGKDVGTFNPSIIFESQNGVIIKNNCDITLNIK